MSFMPYNLPYTYPQCLSLEENSFSGSYAGQFQRSQHHRSSPTYYHSPEPSTPAFFDTSSFTTDPYPTADSPDSLHSGSGRSWSEESFYTSHTSELGSSLLLSPSSFQSSPYSSAPQVLKNSAIRPAETHTIHRNETYAEEFIRDKVQRLTEAERRSFCLPPGTERPNFRCKVAGCFQPWIYQKNQIKEHLSMQHKYNLKKPWACTCGSQFGRQVEADRHLEDQKPCSSCHLPGRKLKGYADGQVCHRCQKKNINHGRLQSGMAVPQ